MSTVNNVFLTNIFVGIVEIGVYFYVAILFLSLEPGILFSLCLSVCLSVRTGRFVLHFVRLTPPTVFNAQKRNLYHMKTHNE